MQKACELQESTMAAIVGLDDSVVENIIEDIDRLSSDKIIILYKPQFEVGKDIKRDSNGVVKDEKAIADVRDTFIQYSQKLGWNLKLASKSKVSGKSGNVEELFYFLKGI